MTDDLLKDLEATPTLTFEPFAEEPQHPAVTPEAEAAPEIQKPVFDESSLTPQERQMVDDFASKIDLSNSQMILQFGAGAQKKMADFSETALNNVRTKDLGEIGSMLSDLVTELKSFDEEEEKGFFGKFRKASDRLTGMKAKYAKAETNVNKITQVLESHQIQLLKDVAMLDKMYELNKNYFKELSMYILAGKQKLEQARNVELAALVEKAEKSQLPEDTQAANDYAAMCDRFEKKIYDLELTRTISMQMAPQIRLIQNNDTAMSEKIQSTLVNTIPLWKSQMVIAIGLSHSSDAAKAQKEVTDMTNALLKKNAETLKVATIETARESERGIVDIETLTATNKTLISTLDEVLKIQEDGRAKRRSAEEELVRIEEEMRQKLLTVSRSSRSARA